MAPILSILRSPRHGRNKKNAHVPEVQRPIQNTELPLINKFQKAEGTSKKKKSLDAEVFV
jgi:hypothetical protein